MEDGIEKGIITEKMFFEELKDEWRKIRDQKEPDYFPIGDIRDREDHNLKFYDFKTSYTRQAIDKAKTKYLEHHDELMNGTLSGLFKDNTIEGKAIQCLKNVARRRLFRSREAENPELAGYRIITGLLNAYKPVLACPEEKFATLLQSRNNPSQVYGQGLDLEWRLVNKLARKYISAYNDHMRESIDKGIPEWYFRAHLLVDYVSGMTDGFALRLYQLLNGIRLTQE